MEELSIKFTSVSAILMSNPAAMRRTGESPAVKRVPTPEAEAETLVYRMSNGQLYVPSDWFRSAGLQACKGLKIGKAAAGGIFKAGLFLTDPYCGLYDPDTGEAIMTYELDTRRCVVQRQGVLRTRPRVEKWSAVATFEHDNTIISRESVLSLFERAGKIVGVGGYRVERGGPFGRFTAQVVDGKRAVADGKQKQRKEVGARELARA